MSKDILMCADCLQYVCLVVHGGLVNEFARRLIPRTRKQERPRVSAAGWTLGARKLFTDQAKTNPSVTS